jgi:DNA-binding response OmpR family regulator
MRSTIVKTSLWGVLLPPWIRRVPDKRTRILVVDDEADIRLALRIALVSLGFDVVDAGSGEEALQKLKTETPEIILLDMNMPGIGGLPACRSIRAISSSRIIVMSSKSSDAEKAEALRAGADDYITKPFSIDQLTTRIRAATP